MHSFNTSLETFNQDVMEASNETLVMIDFWAPWCGPCQTLMPILEKLADEYQGAFKLAKVNIDEQQQLAQQFAVRSVPTVKLVQNGQVIDEFMGALAESEIKELLSKYIRSESDSLMASAIEKYGSGDQSAKQDMIDIINNDPQNNNIRLSYVEVLMHEEQFEDAKAILQALPSDLRERPDIASLISRLDVMAIAEDLGDIDTFIKSVEEDPGNCDARLQLSTVYLANGNFEAALAQLLEIMKRDRQFNDDIGRKDMIKVFEMLGNSGELVAEYRKKMASLLY